MLEYLYIVHQPHVELHNAPLTLLPLHVAQGNVLVFKHSENPTTLLISPWPENSSPPDQFFRFEIL